jgi:hypothetical protein
VNEDLSTLVKVLAPTVEWRKVEHGIAVRPIDQPALERIVEMPVDVRDRVWDWLQNPRVVKREEWMELREPITLVIFEIAKIIWEYGSPLQREVFREMLEKLSKSR